MSNEFDHLVKVIILGDSGVGKTNILSQLCDFRFNQSHVATIGVDFRVKTMHIEGKKIKFQIWDTAGQERFRTVTKSYYNGAQGVAVCYSVTDRSSFENVESWMKSLMENQTKTASIVILANKADLVQERRVSESEGKALADKWSVPFFETSGKDGNNVQESFQCLAEMLLKKLEANPPNEQDDQNKQTLNGASKQKKKKKECC